MCKSKKNSDISKILDVVLNSQGSKKLIRYRDNHVVTTKGERFIVPSKRDQEGEDMKKTYVNLKPLRKYRFH